MTHDAPTVTAASRPAGRSPSGARLRIGTRGSALATTQTTHVADTLHAVAGLDYDLVHVRTDGDTDRSSLASLGGVGVFAAALRGAILQGRVDAAVHSLKDLPTAPVPGLAIHAVPPREDPRDALCAAAGHTLTSLPLGARVGTGSPRRAAQLRALRPDLTIVDLRGNVPTRLGRVTSGDLDAVVLAYAGLRRLGLESAVSEVFDPAVMLPAPGQGALAVEARDDVADDVADALALLDDQATRIRVTAERSVLSTMNAGCATPVGALAEIVRIETRAESRTGHTLRGARLVLRACSTSPDGQRAVRAEAWAELDECSPEGAIANLIAAHDLGREVAEILVDGGAAAFEDATAVSRRGVLDAGNEDDVTNPGR